MGRCEADADRAKSRDSLGRHVIGVAKAVGQLVPPGGGRNRTNECGHAEQNHDTHQPKERGMCSCGCAWVGHATIVRRHGKNTAQFTGRILSERSLSDKAARQQSEMETTAE
jgi:hypothetical protein